MTTFTTTSHPLDPLNHKSLIDLHNVEETKEQKKPSAMRAEKAKNSASKQSNVKASKSNVTKGSKLAIDSHDNIGKREFGNEENRKHGSDEFDIKVKKTKLAGSVQQA